MEIGKKIRDAREDLDITQMEISSQIPMNQSSYSKIERNVLQPNLEQLKRICEILHLDANILLNISKEKGDTALLNAYKGAPHNIKEAILLLLNLREDTL